MIEHRITNQDETVTPISLKDLNIKKIVAHWRNELQKMIVKKIISTRAKKNNINILILL